MKSISRDDQGVAHLMLLFLVIAVVVVGSGYVVMKHQNSKPLNSETSTSDTSSTSSEEPLSDDLSGILSTDKIKQLASEHEDGKNVSQIGLVKTSNGLVFHVEMEDESTVDLDAHTGDIEDSENVHDNNEGNKIPVNFSPSISFAQAVQTAQSKIPKGTVMRVDLESKDGVVLFNVRFSTGAKVYVNATSGAVIKVIAEDAQGKQKSGDDKNHQKGDDSNEEHSGSNTEPENTETHHGSGSSTDDKSGTTSGDNHSGSSGETEDSHSGTSGSDDGGTSGSHD